MRIVIIAICMFGLLLITGHVWAEEVNHYERITTQLELPTCPFPVPANQEQIDANLAHISQGISAILQANRETLDRIKRVIRNEKIMAKGK